MHSGRVSICKNFLPFKGSSTTSLSPTTSHKAALSFPTRRSSDLGSPPPIAPRRSAAGRPWSWRIRQDHGRPAADLRGAIGGGDPRSEERRVGKESAALWEVVGERDVVELPLNGRKFLQIETLPLCIKSPTVH